MLNKRIKSLFVAGLVILGMSGNAFAAELPQGPFKSVATNISITDGTEAVFQNGAIVVDISKEGAMYTYNIIWNSKKFNIGDMNIYFADGSGSTLSVGGTGGTLTDVSDKPGFKSYTFSGHGPEGINAIEVNFNYSKEVDSNGDGIADDLNKNNKPDFKDDVPVVAVPDPSDPETGDAGVAGLLLAAVGIGTGLVVVNKGKDDEEE